MKYLASPYSHPDESVRQARYELAMAATVWLTRQRIWTYSPIVSWHEAAQLHALPTDAAFWLDANSDAQLACRDGTIVLCLPGWKESKGVTGEISFALRHNLSLVELLPVGDSWKWGQAFYQFASGI
jgi:hypothetical protein